VAPRPSIAPSPQARRQAQQLALQVALVARDPRLVTLLLGQWVHRHGLGSLAQLWDELRLVEPQGCAWWNAQSANQQSAGPAHPQPAPASASPEPVRRIEPQLPRASRPAPAPSHPVLVQLRSWLPDQDQERCRAA